MILCRDHSLGFFAFGFAWGAAIAVAQQITALIRGPRGERVVWDIPRERIGAG